jgi:hypothetical protein
MSDKLIVPSGYRLVFRTWYRDKDGNKVYAKDQGKRAWPLLIRNGK